jgi:hypothetical protein
VAGFCEHDNESKGSIKAGKFLDCLAISFSTRTLFNAVTYCSVAIL